MSTFSRGHRAVRRSRYALAVFLVVAPAAFAGSAPSEALESVGTSARTATPPVTGTWQRLPQAPIAPSFSVVSVWTGRQMLVFGRAQPKPPWSVDVAAAYTRRPAPGAG